MHDHHIVPRHMGGGDERSNILRCNIAMHAWLHEQLWKEHSRVEDWIAFKALSGQLGKSEILYELAKMWGARSRGGLSNKGRIRSPEVRANIAASRTLEWRAKQSRAHKGNKYRLGSKHSPGVRELLSAQKRYRFTHEQETSITAQRASGDTLQGIADNIGVSYTAIRNYLRRQ